MTLISMTWILTTFSMKYYVTENGKTLYEGRDFREAFSAWNRTSGRAKINVPIKQLPKYEVGDEFKDRKGQLWRVDDYEIAISKNGREIVYYATNSKGERAKYRSSEVSNFKGGGIVDDYQKVKEGLIFKNEYLAMIVEKFMPSTPEFSYERVGKMMYVLNRKLIDQVAIKAEAILNKIEGTTDYISKMINDKRIEKYTFDVEYDDSAETITVMAFSKQEAKTVAMKRVSEKTQLTGKKLKKIQILAVQ